MPKLRWDHANLTRFYEAKRAGLEPVAARVSRFYDSLLRNCQRSSNEVIGIIFVRTAFDDVATVLRSAAVISFLNSSQARF